MMTTPARRCRALGAPDSLDEVRIDMAISRNAG